MHKSRILEVIRAGAPEPFHAACPRGGGKGGGNDSAMMNLIMAQQAATTQAQLGKEAVNMQTWANRPTINTPWGQQSWQTAATTDPATGQPVTQWTQNLNVTPEQQAALDAQQRIQQGRSGAAESLLGQATAGFQTPMDWNALPQAPGSMEAAATDAYRRAQALRAPDRQREEAALEARLTAQGVDPNSEAYATQKRLLADKQRREDIADQSASFGEGRAQGTFQGALRGTAIDEAVRRRGMTLNELNALLTGQQVAMPQMPSFNQAAKADEANLLGAFTAAGAGPFKEKQGTDWGSAIGGIAGLGAKMYTGGKL